MIIVQSGILLSTVNIFCPVKFRTPLTWMHSGRFFQVFMFGEVHICGIRVDLYDDTDWKEQLAVRSYCSGLWIGQWHWTFGMVWYKVPSDKSQLQQIVKKQNSWNEATSHSMTQNSKLFDLCFTFDRAFQSC